MTRAKPVSRGLVFEGGVLDGVFAPYNSDAESLYSFDTSTGAATFVATVTGTNGGVAGLAPDDSAPAPEPGSLGR